MDLLSLDEVRRRLAITGQSYGGLRPIAVAGVVGSVDRVGGFRADRTRLASLRRAFPDGGFPPIDVYEVGGAYFVQDGHHRVVVAREREIAFLDAEVTILNTNYALPPDVDVGRLIHTDQQRRLMVESGLAISRPDVAIVFARPRGYPELLETIKAYGYDLARAGDDGETDRLPSPADVAARWYDEVYVPGIEAARAAGLPAKYPFKTEADLFLWIYERRRDLRVLDPGAGFAAAAAFARDEGVDRRDRRTIEREAAEPLDRRARP